MCRFLFQPELYPRTSMRSAFDESFGSAEQRALPSNESGLCAFAFEANPLHSQRLKAMEKCYLARGHRLHVFVPNAVSHDAHESIFFKQLKHDNAVMWGGQVQSLTQINTEVRKHFGERFSHEEMDKIMQNPDVFYTLLPDNYTKVMAIDIASFINQHIKDREYDRSKGNGTVMAKMDIEGSEYAVLPHMEKSGVLCKGILDRITTEFHIVHWGLPSNLAHIQNPSDYFDNYDKTPGEHKCSTPTFIELRDSEDYLEDKETPLQLTCPDYQP